MELQKNWQNIKSGKVTLPESEEWACKDRQTYNTIIKPIYIPYTAPYSILKHKVLSIKSNQSIMCLEWSKLKSLKNQTLSENENTERHPRSWAIILKITYFFSKVLFWGGFQNNNNHYSSGTKVLINGKTNSFSNAQCPYLRGHILFS